MKIKGNLLEGGTLGMGRWCWRKNQTLGMKTSTRVNRS